MKILLVEDDPAVADIIIKGTATQGYEIAHIVSGEDGLHAAATGGYDLLICDVMLPGMDGISLVKALRQTHKNLPVIFLSGLGEVDDKVEGLNSGGDDYIAKPFKISELVARIEAVMRRHGDQLLLQELEVGDLRLDPFLHKVYRGSEEVALQPLEFQLLQHMMLNPGRVLSKAMLMEKIWDFNFNPGSNVVEVRIHHLREKVDNLTDKKLIHTVRGIGYVLEERTEKSGGETQT
ncbi:MAG: response regulator transcription factor [Deltaproteobacteria bacterium]|nr:response regulator transcription factor [Deltaproteobacteria bacterium]